MRLIREPKDCSGRISFDLAWTLWEIENGLIEAGIRFPKYDLKDLILLACHIESFSEHTPVVKAMGRVAAALRDLGNGNAATEMGAIEGATVELTKALGGIASALGDIAARE